MCASGGRPLAEVRQLRKRDVDLERRARVIDRLYRGHELGRERLRVHQLEERDVRVHVGGDPGRTELGAIHQRHTCHATVPGEDTRHRAVHPYLRAARARRPCEGVAQAAHPAAYVSPHPPHAIALPHHVVEQHVCGARHGGRRHRADDGVGRERDLELLGLEPAVQDGPRGAGEDLDRLRSGRPELEKAPSQLRQLRQVAGPQRPGVGGGAQQGGLDEIGHPLEHRLVARQRRGVARRELRHLAARQFLVRSHQQEAAVRERREGRGAARQELEAVPGELQVPDDLRAQQAVDVRRGGHLEPGPQLFRDARPTDQLAPLEHQHPHPRAREIGRRHEAVVAGPDDDDVVRTGHRIPVAAPPRGLC